jgi:TRAP-type C4-dicarboxylate transport system permease small subunit
MKLSKGLSEFERGMHRVSQVVSWAARITAVATALLLTTDVLMRLILDEAIKGTVEIVGLATVVVAACSMPYTASENGHLTISTLTEHFAPTSRKIVNAISFLLGTGFCGLVAWRMYTRAMEEAAMTIGRRTAMAEIPYTPFMFLASFMFLLLALEFLVTAYDIASHFSRKQPDAEQPILDYD